ncbi:MAG: hypothetical protein VKJ04_10845 [Vampirovibrionales bacterium]|nr:hypothetical protein [Vampirovibrionales bacterium]
MQPIILPYPNPNQLSVSPYGGPVTPGAFSPVTLSQNGTSDNQQSPLAQGVKAGAKASVSPKQLGIDALIGFVWAGLWRVVDEFRVRSLNKKYPGELFKANWSLWMIPVFVAFGMILRAGFNGYNAYKQAKNERQGISFQI